MKQIVAAFVFHFLLMGTHMYAGYVVCEYCGTKYSGPHHCGKPDSGSTSSSGSNQDYLNQQNQELIQMMEQVNKNVQNSMNQRFGSSKDDNASNNYQDEGLGPLDGVIPYRGDSYVDERIIEQQRKEALLQEQLQVAEKEVQAFKEAGFISPEDIMSLKNMMGAQAQGLILKGEAGVFVPGSDGSTKEWPFPKKASWVDSNGQTYVMEPANSGSISGPYERIIPYKEKYFPPDTSMSRYSDYRDYHASKYDTDPTFAGFIAYAHDGDVAYKMNEIVNHIRDTGMRIDNTTMVALSDYAVSIEREEAPPKLNDAVIMDRFNELKKYCEINLKPENNEPSAFVNRKSMEEMLDEQLNEMDAQNSKE